MRIESLSPTLVRSLLAALPKVAPGFPRIGEEPLRRLRDLYRARFRQCMAVIGGEKAPDAAVDRKSVV